MRKTLALTMAVTFTLLARGSEPTVAAQSPARSHGPVSVTEVPKGRVPGGPDQPLRSALAAEQQVLPTVEALFSSGLDPNQAILKLEADEQLPPELLQAALRLIRVRGKRSNE